MISSWWASVKVDFGAGGLCMTSTALRTIRTLKFREIKLFKLLALCFEHRTEDNRIQ